MNTKRIAVYGLGRSGLAIARGARSLGLTVTIYDRSSAEAITKREVLAAAMGEEFPLQLNWKQHFDPAEVDVVVTNPAVDKRSEVLQKAIEDGIEVWSEVEFAYRLLQARFGSQAPVLVAITGTNGKSTTTVITYLALRACGVEAVLCGNIFGTGLPEIPLTEAATNATQSQVLVAEISSFQLEWTSHFRPDIAGITNISPDHLDRYDSFDEYRETKHRIFAAQTEADYAVVRAYDPQVNAPGSNSITGYQRRRPGGPGAAPTGSAGPTILTFGAQGEHAQVLEEEVRILDASIRTDELKVIGTHNYANTAMAGLLAYGAMNSLATRPVAAGERVRTLLEEARATSKKKGSLALPTCIAAALKEFKGIEHRMELLGERNGVKVINNSMCTNPDAVVKSAQAVRGPNHLIMGGKDKDLPFAPVKNYLASGMHKAYLFGESKDLINSQLGGSFPTYNTLQDAFRAATDKARPGEVIMLAPGCASTDQFNDFRDRGNVFKSIAMEWLKS